MTQSLLPHAALAAQEEQRKYRIVFIPNGSFVVYGKAWTPQEHEIMRGTDDACRAYIWQQVSLAVLRVVLEREPTEAMKHAIAMAAWHSGSGVNPATVWKAAASELLKEAGA